MSTNDGAVVHVDPIVCGSNNDGWQLSHPFRGASIA